MVPAAFALFFALLLVYALGPRPRRPRLTPPLPSVPSEASQIEAWLAAKESSVPVRPDNQARVVWAGEPDRPTDWCILYLHGFSACWREGAPVHLNTARRYGANLLLTRLQAHGLRTEEPLLELDATALWEDAKEALALARVLGRKVLVMATSSGAPLALRLASVHRERVNALVLYSPNLRIRRPLARILDWPWGIRIARLVQGGKYRVGSESAETSPYWYDRVRLEGAAQLQALLDATTRGRDFGCVFQPVYSAVYFRDGNHRDPIIDVGAVRAMMARLGTPAELKRLQEFPEAGHHVIACDLTNPHWEQVQAGTWDFLEGTLGWRAASDAPPIPWRQG